MNFSGPFELYNSIILWVIHPRHTSLRKIWKLAPSDISSFSIILYLSGSDALSNYGLESRAWNQGHTTGLDSTKAQPAQELLLVQQGFLPSSASMLRLWVGRENPRSSTQGERGKKNPIWEAETLVLSDLLSVYWIPPNISNPGMQGKRELHLPIQAKYGLSHTRKVGRELQCKKVKGDAVDQW